MMHQLIRDYFVPTFDLKTLHDSAVIDNLPPGKLAVTTDSYVISPYFFPGVILVCFLSAARSILTGDGRGQTSLPYGRIYYRRGFSI